MRWFAPEKWNQCKLLLLFSPNILLRSIWLNWNSDMNLMSRVRTEVPSSVNRAMWSHSNRRAQIEFNEAITFIPPSFYSTALTIDNLNAWHPARIEQFGACYGLHSVENDGKFDPENPIIPFQNRRVLEKSTILKRKTSCLCERLVSPRHIRLTLVALTESRHIFHVCVASPVQNSLFLESIRRKTLEMSFRFIFLCFFRCRLIPSRNWPKSNYALKWR